MMKTYKDTQGKIHCIDPDFLHFLPDGCVEITKEEADAIRNPPPSAAQIAARLQADVDDFMRRKAQERKYDTIHTAALRAAFAGPFHDEGVAYAEWMDACNAYLYTVQAACLAGERSVPTGPELIAELPPLVLPEPVFPL